MDSIKKPINYKLLNFSDDASDNQPDMSKNKADPKAANDRTGTRSYSPQKYHTPPSRNYIEFSKLRMSQIQAYVNNKAKAQKKIELFTNTKNTFNIDMSEVDIRLMTDNMYDFKKEYEEFSSKAAFFEKRYLPGLNIHQVQILWRALHDRNIENIPLDEEDIIEFKKRHDMIPTLENAIAREGDYYPRNNFKN